MAINIYEEITNPVTGETIKGLSITPYAFSMEWRLKPGSYVPLDHIHLHQDELFHVKKGLLNVTIEGKEHTAGPGEMIIVSKGKRHMATHGDGGALEAVVEYRPALDQEKLIQCFAGLILDGYTDGQGAPNAAMLGYMQKRMKCKAMALPAGISVGSFRLALNFYLVVGTVKGWGKLYEKYTR